MALDVPTGYRALKEADVAAYLADVPAVATSIGGKAADWKVREVGDGNLNLVFIVEGPKSGVVLKQALPYVRLVGESWPLSVRRAFFEHQALLAQGAVAPRPSCSSKCPTRATSGARRKMVNEIARFQRFSRVSGAGSCANFQNVLAQIALGQ
jgi:hypothetical protein